MGRLGCAWALGQQAWCGQAEAEAGALGQVYCVDARSCVDFFFPASKQAEFAALFRADVRGRCADSAGEGPQGRAHPDYCGGGGNVSCFRAQWSTGVQVGGWLGEWG